MPFSYKCSYFVFQIFCKKRDDLLHEFKKKIGVSIHYATPLPFMTYYKKNIDIKKIILNLQKTMQIKISHYQFIRV